MNPTELSVDQCRPEGLGKSARDADLAYDRQHIWHPYSAAESNQPLYYVEQAKGVYLDLSSGEKLIDGMSSWWCAIHGYNHSQINRAIQAQLDKMSHVMFGGLTHGPAIELAQKLIDITPQTLQQVFFADSGSVSVEVAIKMAVQYFHAQGQPQKNRLLSLRSGYHGDTFAAMSVCDPVTGMHHVFKYSLIEQYFVSSPATTDLTTSLIELERTLEDHHEHIAAFIFEPIVQGAGGMQFYSSQFLKAAKDLCAKFDVLMIADEIATGFGRTGKMFACEHADIEPDIMCLGKALTGGYMTLAATLCTKNIARVISAGEAKAFMHGPTFMGNPLACATANASIDLLLSYDWQKKVHAIQGWLEHYLAPLQDHALVKEVRFKGAIGVVELHKACDLNVVQPVFVDYGVWLRPFGKLIYTMPPFIIEEDQVEKIAKAMKAGLDALSEVEP